MDAVQVDDGVGGVQWAGLPGLDLFVDRIGHRGNQAGRNRGAIHLFEMALNSRTVMPQAYSEMILLSKSLRTSSFLVVIVFADKQALACGEFSV